MIKKTNTVAELQDNQIKSIISNCIIRLLSIRANLLLYFRKLVVFLFPYSYQLLLTLQRKCILHFPVFDNLFDNEEMCYITVLVGLLDQCPIIQHRDFEVSSFEERVLSGLAIKYC